MSRSLVLVLVLGCGKSSPDPAPQPTPAPVAVKHEDRHDPAVATPKLELDVKIGDTTTKWQRDSFAKVAHFVGKNNDGEARDVWSLRELAHTLVGPNARVVAVAGAEATKTIEPSAWVDPAHTPVLQTTRRGSLKFRWTDKDGTWGETEVKDVIGLEIAP